MTQSPFQHPLPGGYELVEVLRDEEERAVLRARRTDGLSVLLRLSWGAEEQSSNELALLAAVRDPEIARFVDGGALAGGGRFLAREWIDGEELGAWAKDRPHEELGEVIARLAAALHRLHEAGFVHADLKPANVIVSEDGTPHLCDFGLASRTEGGSTRGGSLFYAAPEVLLDGPSTPASDLFALGVLLHELLIGERPSARAFYGQFPQRPFLDAIGALPEVFPAWVRDIVVSLLRREPTRRPSSAAQVAQTLAQRLGIQVATPSGASKLLWSPAIGRLEGWKSTLDRLREEESPGAQWIRIPDEEHAGEHAHELRLFAAWKGETSKGLDWEQHVAGIASLAELDERCGMLFETAQDDLLVVWTNRATPWMHRTIEYVAARIEQMEREAPAGMTRRSPILVVVAPFEPAAQVFEVVRTPGILKEAVHKFLRNAVEEPDENRLGLFADRVAKAGKGSATRLNAVLEEGIRRGWILLDGPRPRLRPGPLPSIESMTSDGRDPRRAALDSAATDVLLACEVIGSPTDPAHVRRLLGSPPEEFAHAVQSVRAAGCVALQQTSRGPFLELIARLSAGGHEQRRKELHERWAEILEEIGGSAEDVLIHRWAGAADEERMAEALDFAAELREQSLAERALAFLEALEERGRGIGSRVPHEFPGFAVAKAECWCELGQPEHAGKWVDELVKSATNDRALLARVELCRARVAGLCHRPDDALRHVEEAVRLEPELAVQGLISRLELAHHAGRDEEVLELATQYEAANLEDSEISRRRQSYVESLIAMSAFRRGQVGRAREVIRRLAHEAKRVDDRVREAALRLHLATIERRTGSGSKQARFELERSGRLFERSGHLAGAAHVRATMAGLQREAGELIDAEELYLSARDIRTRLNDREGAAMVQGMIGLLAADRGHARKSIEDLGRSAKALSGATKNRHAALLMAREREMRRRIEASEEALATPSESYAKRSSDPRVQAAFARALWLDGRSEDAQNLARIAMDRAMELGREPARKDLENLLRALDFVMRGQSAAEEIAAEAGHLIDEPAPTSLEAQDALLFAMLAQRSAFPSHEAGELAQAMLESGRDDRAARLFLAVAKRETDARRARWAREQAEEALQRCTHGLTKEEEGRFREHLLGFPDPWPEDLLPPRQENWDGVPSEELVSLLEVTESLLEQDDLSSLLRLIVDHAIAISRAERGFLVLEQERTLRFDMAMHSMRGEISAPELEISHSIVRSALKEMQPLRVSNAVDDPLLEGSISVDTLELRSVLCVPFTVSDRVRGVLYLDHRLCTEAFDLTSERLCGLLAGQAALAIRQTMSREEIKQLNEKLSRRVAATEVDLANARKALGKTAEAMSPVRIVGSSAVMSKVDTLLDRAARTEISVLVLGPSGSGKELIARALHERSARSAGPFVVENCAAIPPTLIEAELFGHAKGAFTDAHQDRAGLFESANGGTLFLDEIGEMPLETQVRLLRTLESGEFRRVGESQARRADFRLVTATNRDLIVEVEAGRFRRDLFYRLDGLHIVSPSLDERLEDIPELVHHFLKLEEERTGVRRRIDRRVLKRLSKRSWPGNVRELSNEIRRLCAMCDGDIEDPSLLNQPEGAVFGRDELIPLAEMERRLILEALERTRGDKLEAARMLGISKSKIYQRLRQWGL